MNLKLDTKAKIRECEKKSGNKTLISIYFFLSFLSIYNTNYKQFFLIGITILSVYFFLLFILKVL